MVAKWLLLPIGFFAGLAAAPESRGAEPRYFAVWVDGRQTAADEIAGWGRSDSQPSLAGRPLYDSQNPIRTLVDTTCPRPALPERYVEFRGGDRLPGRVVKFAAADETTGMAAHLVVELDGELGFPNVFARSHVRVDPCWVRRIVDRPPADANVPTQGLRASSGASLAFQELRWRREGVQVLADSGVKTFAFADITLLDAGPWKGWEAWYRQLGVLSPGIDSRLVRLDLADGTRLTTSLERLKPRSQGGDDPEKWFHLLQPAWSLDLLAVAHRTVRGRTFFASHEAPLSAVEPNASRHQAVFSQGWGTVRTDANVHGDPLRAGGREFGWGFGVHAYHELEFELPPSARRFRTKLGLDPWAGTGGCARGRVQLGEETLFESPLIIGTGPAVECGPLLLRPGEARLLLVADADAGERPSGADPFDIRDVFNWLEPVVEFDPGGLRREIERFYLYGHRGLEGWKVQADDGGNWRPVNRFDEADQEFPGFRLWLQIDGPVTLTRVVAGGPRPRTALLEIGCVARSAAQTSVEISMDGRRISRERLPGPNGSLSPLQFAIPLSLSAGKCAEFSVRLEPAGRSVLLDWRGMRLGEEAGDE